MATDATDQSIELPVNKKRKSGPNEGKRKPNVIDESNWLTLLCFLKQNGNTSTKMMTTTLMMLCLT